MSTKPIRRALKILNNFAALAPTEDAADSTQSAYAAALEAVRAIEEMARFMATERTALSTAPSKADAAKSAMSTLRSIAKEAP